MNVPSSNKRTTKNTKKVLIGVIGRAGSGKSTFTRMLAQNRASILEADKIAWELYSNPTVRKNLAEAFGRKILNKDGTVNHKALGDVAFPDPSALNKLNAIIHPLLVGELKHRIERSSERAVVIDAALLLDWPLARECDLLIAVESEESVLLARLKSKGVGIKRALSILENQRSRQEFRELCHVMVENNKGLSELKLKADKIWQERIKPLLGN